MFGLAFAAASAFSDTALKPRPGGSIRPFCEPATETSPPHPSCSYSIEPRPEMVSPISNAGWLARSRALRTSSGGVTHAVEDSLCTTLTALILCALSAARRSSIAAMSAPLLAEEHVPFRRELAALVARSPYGQGAAYPIVQTVQRDGICHEVIAPAPGLDADVAEEAQRLALDIADRLGVTGLLAVELFETDRGVLVNELAMRPHNSGHWTIEGARTSQFEQHLRAVLDLPLGDTRPTAPYAVMANVLGGDDPKIYPRYIHVMAHDPGMKVHFYGKEIRPGRKIGHVTALGADLDDVRDRARHAADYLRNGPR